MKVLILGGSGMLGHKLVQVLSNKFDVCATIRGNALEYKELNLFNDIELFENLDVTNFTETKKLITDLNPDVVINAIGIIKQKEESRNVIKTLEINAIFPHRIAEITNEINSRFITLSTDCVFDGEKGNYSENDFPNARDLYGKSKNLGEVLEGNSLTIRTSIIGREITTTKSLVEWFINNEDEEIKGFTKAIYTGFPTIVISEIISDVIENHKDLRGLYHVSSDRINKFNLLTLVNNQVKANKKIVAFDGFEIDRSLDSTKFRNETGFIPASWKEMIKMMLDDPTPYEEWRKQKF